jgi:hypothetical protein
MNIRPHAVFVSFVFILAAWFMVFKTNAIEPNPLRGTVDPDMLEWLEVTDGGDFETTHLITRQTPHPLYPLVPIATMTRDAAAARTGSWGFRLEADASQAGYFAARAEVDKARNNIYSLWIRSPNSPRSVQFSLVFEQLSNEVVSTEFSPLFAIGTNWTYCCFTNGYKSNFRFAFFGLAFSSNTLLYLDDLSVRAPVWTLAAPTGATANVGGIDVPATPIAPVLFSLLIHIEDPVDLYTDPDCFWRKTSVFSELARIIHGAGGFLTIQPEYEWVASAQSNAPGLILNLATNYDMRFSVHTHGPNCVDSNNQTWGHTACSITTNWTRPATDDDVAPYASDRVVLYSQASGVAVEDHNGNWDMTNMSMIAQAGIRTLSGMKNHNTQRSFNEYRTNPWRPSAVNSLDDPLGYQVHDPLGRVIYIPGIGASVSKFPDQIAREFQGYLSQAISLAETGRVNTCYIITHVDHFFSIHQERDEDYILVDAATNITYSANFLHDLDLYSNALYNIVKPLADAGYVQWAELPEMGREFVAWEKRQTNIHALALVSPEGQAWLDLALSNACDSIPFWNELHLLGSGDDLSPDASRPDSLAPTAGTRTHDIRDWLFWGNDYLDGLGGYACSSGSNRVISLMGSMSNALITSEGIEPGDPFAAERSLASLKAVFRHPGGSGGLYTNAGSVYRPLDDLFAANPDTLFVPVTPPPAWYAPSDPTTDADAQRAREFSAWLAGEWLSDYNATHPNLHNVVVFNWFDALANAESDTNHPNRLRAEYGGETGAASPNLLAASQTAEQFAESYSNTLYSAWRAFATRSTNTPLEAFSITQIDWSADIPNLSWESAQRVTYGIQYRNSLTSTCAWQKLHHVAGQTGTTSLAVTYPVLASNSFFCITATTGSIETGHALFTFVPVSGIGDIAIEILSPSTPRYTNNAASPIVAVRGFLLSRDNFDISPDFSDIGLIHIAYLWPGGSDRSGVASEGEYDYAGTNGIRALAEVIKFASGQAPDRDGRYLHELITLDPLYKNTGLFAASHPGIAVARVMAEHGLELTNVAFFVGWENPTLDAIVSCDIGNRAVATPLNRGYDYPADYSDTNVTPPYETLRWETGTAVPFPYFDLNSNGAPDTAADYLFVPPAHSAWGLEYYSRSVLRALIANGQLNPASWPTHLATLEQAEAFWAWRDAPSCYPLIASCAPDMAVMLIFGTDDHVQTARDKPHIHHAWQGFKSIAPARWCRLNPDRVYSTAINAGFGAVSPDNDANFAPTLLGWSDITNLAYAASYPQSATHAALAAAAEMADRCRYTNWTDNLTNVLTVFP